MPSGVDSVHSRVCVMLNAVYTIYIYIFKYKGVCAYDSFISYE